MQFLNILFCVSVGRFGTRRVLVWRIYIDRVISKHSVCLTCTGLTVHKDSAIDALQSTQNYLLAGVRVDVRVDDSFVVAMV